MGAFIPPLKNKIMRIINVVEINEGNVKNITSFGIYEEQCSEEVVKEAEKLFIDKCYEYGYDELDEQLPSAEDLIEDGYYDGGNFAINLVWSYID
jgi:hypothetical protein